MCFVKIQSEKSIPGRVLGKNRVMVLVKYYSMRLTSIVIFYCAYLPWTIRTLTNCEIFFISVHIFKFLLNY